nr:MAG TPA: hypothetical protein [Caudoviricetes sp.]
MKMQSGGNVKLIAICTTFKLNLNGGSYEKEMDNNSSHY